jgi:hypothetical protein
MRTYEERMEANRIKARAYYHKNSKKLIENSRERRKRYNAANKERKKEYNKLYREKNKHKIKDTTLKHLYGITTEQYKLMLEQQNYKCGICNIEQKNAPSSELCVDHCHSTGEVRGLLCHPCNRVLGHFKDNLSIIRNATIYLTKYLDGKG